MPAFRLLSRTSANCGARFQLGLFYVGIVTALIFLSLPAPVWSELVDPAPRTEQMLNWKMGDMKADPTLNLVYILNSTDNRLLALDTSTGTTIASVSVPSAVENGKIEFSIDGETVYVSTPYTNSLHSFTTGSLTPIGSVDLEHSVRDFVIGSDGFLYAVRSAPGINELLKIDVSTGFIVSASTPAPSTINAMMIRNSAGNRIFLMAVEGSGRVEEIAVNPGSAPVHTATHEIGVSNARDLTFDESSNTLYATGGGTYGIQSYNINTMVSTFWPYGSAYGVAVAQISGSSDVFGASGSGRIRRFAKSSGNTMHDYIFSTGGLEETNIIPGNMEVTPNGYLVYGKKSSISSNEVNYIGLIGHDSLSLPDSVSHPDPRAHKEVITTWTIGDTLGDPSRDMVYLVDQTNSKLIAFDTATGQATADVPIPGGSPVNGKLGLSPDGTILFFTTPATAQLHRFDAANNLSYLGSTQLSFAAHSFVIASDGCLYATKNGDLQKVNADTGAIEGEITDPHFYGIPLIRRNDDGSRFFMMALGLSGGTHAVNEFAIVDGDVPIHTGTAFDDGHFNDIDLTFDDARNTLYRAGGGIYGVSVWRGDQGITNRWPFDSPYGRAVAQHPASTSVFGASGSEHIREFDKDTGKVLRTFDHHDINGGFWSGNVVADRLEIAMNDVVVYGKDNYLPGPSYLGVIGLENFSFPRSGPTRPMNVSASDGIFPDKVVVTWNEVTGASEYEIYRLNNDYRPSSYDTPAAIVATATWTDWEASETSVHRYWVKAVNAFGESTLSDREYGSRIVPTAPVAPTEVFASDGTDSDGILVTWNAVSEAASYQVYRNTSDHPDSSTRVANEVKGQFWVDNGAAFGVNYYYWVKAANGGGASVFSPVNRGHLSEPPESTLPATPLGISATQGSLNGAIAVSWYASSRAESYRVFRSLTDSVSTSEEVADALTGTNWVDSEAIPWTTRFYWIVASNDEGDSEYSAVASGYAKGVPETPTSVVASDGLYSDRIEVFWNSAAGAATYTVYRNTVADGNTAVEVAAEVGGSTWNDTNVVIGSTYYYWVKSVNSEGEGDLSAPDSGYPLNPITPPPYVSATDGFFTDRVEINWGEAQHADSYKVFRGNSVNSESAQEVASGLVTRLWSDTSVTPGISYYYWIKSTNQGGDSDFSVSDSGYARLDPVAPTGLSATDGTFLDRIGISWNSSPSADSYYVYWAEAPDGNYIHRIYPASVTSFFDMQMIPGKIYYYYIRSFTVLGGLSDPGPVESGYQGVRNPLSVIASDGLYQGEVRLSWESVPGADSYQIFRGKAPNGNDALLIGSSSTTAFTDISGEGGEEYYYFVKSETGAAVSVLSGGDAGRATRGLPFRPDGLIGKTPRGKVGDNAYFPTSQRAQLVSKRSKKLLWYLELQNDGETADDVAVSVTKGNRFFKLKLISLQNGNVTSLAYLGRLNSALPSRASTSYKLDCKPSRTTRGKVKKRTFSIVGRSKNDVRLIDVLQARAVTAKR